MPILQQINLALRAVTETGVVLGLAYWGWRTGAGTGEKILLAMAAPVLGFGFWGVVDFRWAGRAAEPLRLIQELAISGLAALAVYAAGAPAIGLALAATSLAHHGLVYAIGDRLLK